MRRLGLIGLSLATLGCVRLNPSYDAGESGGGSTGKGTQSSTGVLGSSTGQAGSSSATSQTSNTSSTAADTASQPQFIDFTDQSWVGGFADSEILQSLEWSNDSIRLVQSSEEGTLESRIFDAGSVTEWFELRWIPQGPYGVPLRLPVDGDAPTYPTGDIGYQGLIFLAHLDGAPFSEGDIVADASGLHDGVWFGDTTLNDPGVFGRALVHQDDNPVEFNRVELSSAIQPGFNPFTWSLWYLSESCSDSNMLVLDSAGGDQDTTGTYFMSCSGPGAPCPSPGPGHALAVLRGPAGASVRVCSDVRIDDEEWHHIAFRRRVLGSGQIIEIFVDGRLADAGSQPSVTDVSVHETGAPAENFTLAGGNEGIHSGAGSYDEFAFWNRALGDEEIENLYLRGTRTARFQVRACDEPDCSDQDFMGPAGDNPGSGYVDAGPQFDHAIDLSELDLRGRYVQYRFLLERREGDSSPAIQAVTLTGFQE